MRKHFAAAALVAALAAPAAAAELPSREAKPPAQKARGCEIDGKQGVLASDGATCIRLGGYISGQVEGGNLK